MYRYIICVDSHGVIRNGPRDPDRPKKRVGTTCEVEQICFRFDFLGYIQVPGGETPNIQTGFVPFHGTGGIFVPIL